MMSRPSAGFLGLAILLAAGCSPPNAGPDPEATASISVQPHATMLVMQPLAGTARAGVLPNVSEIWEGELQARKLDDNSLTTYYWSAGFDPVAYTFESYKTILLVPGTYELTLLLEHNGDQYVGTAVAPITDGTNAVSLALSPVIGDHLVEVSVAEELADFRFDYDAGELIGLSNPRLGVIVDGGPEQILALDPTTGDSLVYLNLADGPHQLRLNLYDGSLHLARSRPEQEAITVAPGTNHQIDLIPLRGETTVSLGIDGGPASFTLRVPEEVAAEAGGLASLNTIFAFSGQQNVVFETAVTLQPSDPGLLSAEVTVPGAHYGGATLSLSFHDADVGPSPGELLGSCTAAVTLGSTAATVTCQVQLRRRAVIGGSLLAALGVNVFTEAGAPVPGSLISISGAPAGISGSGNFGTAGYFQTYLLRGTYLVRAEHVASQMSGEQSITLAPLEVGNVDIFLSSDLPPVCGDGQIDPAGGEQCDDGNQTSGDGCSSTCATEDGFTFRVAGTYPFVVPAACTQIAVKMWGAGGGGGFTPSGGGGGFTTGLVGVTPGESMTIMVGEGGIGRGAPAGSGDGGGGTALLRFSTPLLVAGAGGGGGSGDTPTGGGGGGALGETGGAYSGGGPAFGGAGGTQTAPGAGGVGSRRTGFAGLGHDGGHGSNRCGGSGIGGGGTGFGNGGLGYPYCSDGGGGGGGGGWFGGGGGGGNWGGAGGGGGAGYVASSPGVTQGSMVSGSGSQPGNSADADRQNAGTGGSTSTRGSDGAVVIRCQD